MHALRLLRPMTASSSDPGPPRGSSDVRDAELIVSTQAGDQEAFRLLVERYQHKAYGIALGILGREEDARDVAQEAFVRVFRSIDRFDFSRTFYTWLYRIVQNLAIDAMRKHGLRRGVNLDDVGDTLSAGEAPEDPLEANETVAEVRQVLAELPKSFRTVMILRDLEGLSCKEIAPIVGATHATVRWRLHRARKLFKEHWERRERTSERSHEPKTHQADPVR